MDSTYDRRGNPHYRKFYARLVKAMSMPQALQTLGLPPGSNPSEDEVRHAQRKRLVEIGYKGLGGGADPQEATEINVAADILLGRRNPDREAPTGGPSGVPPTDYSHGGPGWNPAYAHPESPPKRVEVSFDQAVEKAGVPTDAEWLFVTTPQRAEGNYSSDEFSRNKGGWVAVGRKGAKFVFVGVERSTYNAYVAGGGAGHDIYKVRVYEYEPASQVSPSWLHGNVVTALKSMGDGIHFNSKVCDVRGKTFSERLPREGGPPMSIKHMMVDLGLVAGDDPSVAGRKQVVEMRVDLDHAFGGERPKAGFFPAPQGSHMYWGGEYHGDYYHVVLILNGKEFALSENDWNTFYKLKVGGLRVLAAIFGDRFHSGARKILTRMPKAKSALILGGMVEHFKDLPADALAVLAKAAEQVKA